MRIFANNTMGRVCLFNMITMKRCFHSMGSKKSPVPLASALSLSAHCPPQPFSSVVGVALSGGVDSAVAALLLRHFVRTPADVRCLRDGRMTYTMQRLMTSPSEPSSSKPYCGAETAQRKEHIASLLPLLPPPRRVFTADEICGLLSRAIDMDASTSSDASYCIELQAFFMQNWHPTDHDIDADDTGTTCTAVNGVHCRSRGDCEVTAEDREDAHYVWEHPCLQPPIPHTSAHPPPSQSPSPSSSSRAHPPLVEVDFSDLYFHRVYLPFVEAFLTGHSLNPDVLCNREIKFRALLEYVQARAETTRRRLQHEQPSTSHSESLKSPPAFCGLATGHYATTRLIRTAGTDEAAVALCTPARLDGGLNDQSHFLCRLCPQTQLPLVLFPTGTYLRTKHDVRAVAKAFFGARIADRKTSTGLCFVPKTPPTKKKLPPLTKTKSPPSSLAQRTHKAEAHGSVCNSLDDPKRSRRAEAVRVGRDSPFRRLLVQAAFNEGVAMVGMSGTGSTSCKEIGSCEHEKAHYESPPVAAVPMSSVQFYFCESSSPPRSTDDAADTSQGTLSGVLDPAKGQQQQQWCQRRWEPVDATAVTAIAFAANGGIDDGDGGVGAVYPFDFAVGTKVMLKRPRHHRPSAPSSMAPSSTSSQQSSAPKAKGCSPSTAAAGTAEQPSFSYQKAYVCRRDIAKGPPSCCLEAVWLVSDARDGLLYRRQFRVDPSTWHPMIPTTTRTMMTPPPSVEMGGNDHCAMPAAARQEEEAICAGASNATVTRTSSCSVATVRCLVSVRHHDRPEWCRFNPLSGEVEMEMPTDASLVRDDDRLVNCGKISANREGDKTTVLPNSDADALYSANGKWNVTSGQFAVFYRPLSSLPVEDREDQVVETCDATPTQSLFVYGCARIV